MKNEILDDILIPNQKKSIQSKLLSWTSLIILWFGICGTLISSPLSTKVITAIILLSIVTIIYYFNLEISVKIMLGLIIAGIFGIIEFLPVTAYISYGTDYFNISINLILVFIGMIHYLTNKEYLIKYFAFFYAKNDSPTEEKSADRSRIDGFKRRFSNKPISELIVISQHEKLVKEANIAAEELIKEKEAQ